MKHGRRSQLGLVLLSTLAVILTQGCLSSARADDWASRMSESSGVDRGQDAMRQALAVELGALSGGIAQEVGRSESYAPQGSASMVASVPAGEGEEI